MKRKRLIAWVLSVALLAGSLAHMDVAVNAVDATGQKEEKVLDTENPKKETDRNILNKIDQRDVPKEEVSGTEQLKQESPAIDSIEGVPKVDTVKEVPEADSGKKDPQAEKEQLEGTKPESPKVGGIKAEIRKEAIPGAERIERRKATAPSEGEDAGEIRKAEVLSEGIGNVLMGAVGATGTVKQRKFAEMEPEEQLEALKATANEEEAKALFFGLNQRQREKLADYATEHGQTGSVTLPKTVSMTVPAPFMPAVSLKRGKMLRSGSVRKTDAIVTSKTVTGNDEDGTYTLKMETYTTGKVTTTQEMSPVDIVLVLDQSGSMSSSFGSGESRQDALQAAVKNFITAVHEKYTEEADHRIAIVTFESNAQTVANWTSVDSAGETALKNTVTNLAEPSGVTRVDLGMTKAQEELAKGYSGTNPRPRQKVVIVFTDGVPVEGSDQFSVPVADRAIATSKQLKEQGCTVYTIGIFHGANPAQIHGGSTGEVGDFWKKKTLIIFGDITDFDIPAGNRFLNFLSSNFITADKLGAERTKTLKWAFIIPYYEYRWTITRNFNRKSSGYYLAASNAEELDNIFQAISQQIAVPSVTVGKEAVIKDIISHYFELSDVPSNPDVMQATVALKTGPGTNDWGSETTNPNVTVTYDDDKRTVAVSGFDFDHNYVTEDPRTEPGEGDNFRGRKLIIRVKIKPRPGFFGGNDVPTNSPNSGLYRKPTDAGPLEAFETPTANLPIRKDMVLTVTPKNTYLATTIAHEVLFDDMTVTLDGLTFKYNDLTWQKAFVDCRLEPGFDADPFQAMNDTEYWPVLNMKPHTDGLHAIGTPNPMTPDVVVTGAKQPIHVFVPEVTFHDLHGFYGDELPAMPTAPDKVQWKHGTTYSTDAGVVMVTDEPTVDYTLTPDPAYIQGGLIHTKKDIPVAVQAMIGGWSVQNKLIYIHTPCDAPCNWTGNPTKDKAFVIHVDTGELTIRKNGIAVGETAVFTIQKDGENYTEVVVTGNSNPDNNKVTVKQLPKGVYTVKESTDWLWRYTATSVPDPAVATLNAATPQGEVAFTDTLNIANWLNGYSTPVHNVFRPN